jgi:tetratricopeptide (TPR) repeat protein
MPGPIATFLRRAVVAVACLWASGTVAAETPAAVHHWSAALDQHLARLSAAPTSFAAVEQLILHLEQFDSASHRARLRAAAESLPGTGIGRLVRLVADTPALDPADRLALARDWLAGVPDDVDAWRFAGRQHLLLQRFDEAAHALARGGDTVGRAAALLRLGRMDEARRAVEETAVGVEALRSMAAALTLAGEFGRGRRLLDAAQDQWPEDGGLALERGRMELAAGRPVRAIGPLKRAVAARPGEREAVRLLVRAWRTAGMPVRAQEAFTAAAAAGLEPDGPVLAEVLAAMRAMNDDRRAEPVARAWLDTSPESHWAMREKAAALDGLGAHAEAASLMRASFELLPPTDDSLARFLTISQHNQPDAMVEATLAQLRRDYPAAPAVWRWSAKRLVDTGAGMRSKRVLAEKATVAVPNQAWPWLDLAALLEPSAAREVLERGLAAMPVELAGQRAQLHLRRAAVAASLDAALADLDEHLRLGGEVAAFHAARRGVLAAAGRWDEAAAEAWAWTVLAPDDTEAQAAIFLPEVRERLGYGTVYAHLADVVDRNPHDPARLLAALERQTGPGGSPVLALGLARDLDRVDPDDPHLHRGRELRNEALADLGRLGRLVDVDLNAMRLRLERPDGIAVVVEAHPASGRPLLRQEGPAWTRARWEMGGRLLAGLSDSAGNAVRLTHDERGRPRRMDGEGGAAFSATLAEDGSVAAIEGPGGRQTAVRAMTLVLPVLAGWTQGDLAALPELPAGDVELDRLLAAERNGGAKAVLAVAAHLVERLGDRRGHAAAARRRLDEVLDQAFGHPQQQALGLEAARLWHRWARTAFPDGGLPAATWDRWTTIADWVNRLPPSPRRDAVLLDIATEGLRPRE